MSLRAKDGEGIESPWPGYIGGLLYKVGSEELPGLEECKYCFHMTFHEAVYNTVTFYRSPVA